MTAQDLLRLSLELEPGAEPISGRLYEDEGRVRAFSGWLGLFAALQAVVDRPDHLKGEL